ncbi:MAG: hypothetical protein EOO77_14515 [Oxalobacteraceae bacterium]|nr:MAG: hypothetical protein EOO77_14515 [Oxalobacteraceae bacterium]
MFNQSIQEFVEAVSPQMNIWHNTTRKGDTGAGHTCETIIFGKEEDNKSLADFMGFECKSVLATSKNARVRLLNFAGGAEAELCKRFGKVSPTRGYNSFTRQLRCNKPIRANGSSIALVIEDNELSLLVDGQERVGEWLVDAPGRSIATKVADKIADMALIRYEKRVQDGLQQYRYTGVDFHTGLSLPRLITAFGAQHIAVEFRYTDKKDYGTSFNMSMRHMEGYWPHHTTVTWGDGPPRLTARR